MRTLYSSLQRPIGYIFSGLFALVLTSCGTYYSAGYEEDGIYASNEVETETEETTNARSSYYKQYFQSKDKSYEDLPEDGVIFTDIDAYSTTESLDDEGNIVVEEREIAYEEGYGGWGTNNSDVIVNVYNTAGWGGGWGLGWGGGWGWGLNAGWGWGWNNPWWGWGYGFRPFWGWGGGYWGWGGGWWCPPNAWGGFNGNPYYYRGGFYGNNGIAYNRGRRNLDYATGRTVSSNRGSYTHAETNRRINRINGRTSNRNSINSGRDRSNRVTSGRSGSRNTINRPSRNRNNSFNTNRNRPSNRVSRPSTRSSRPSFSRPASRPSGGSFRGSSGGGMRGGSMRGGGGRRGGRG